MKNKLDKAVNDERCSNSQSFIGNSKLVIYIAIKYTEI
jgi:hypothetical protein